jgi:hypothetical protein
VARSIEDLEIREESSSVVGRSVWWCQHRRAMRWAICLTGVFLCFASWSVASPLMAPPDEAAHLFKAAAVVRGQLVGKPGPKLPNGSSNPYVTVRVPASFANAESLWGCYTYRLYQPASCAPKLAKPAHDHLVAVTTYVGRYPPLYYLLVGWPSLLFPSTTGVYLVRLMSALLSALFLTSALMSAIELRRSRMLVLGVAAAATPMVLYLGATINPNGLEVSSALSLWTSGLVLALDGRVTIDRRVLARAGLAAAVLVQIRGLSPLWLAAISISVLAASDRTRLRLAMQDRAVQVWIAIVALCSAFSLWWIFHYQALDQIGGQTYPAPRSTSLPHLTVIALGFVDTYVKGMIGLLGRPDTPPPALTIYLWLGVTAGLLGLAFFLTRRRRALLLGALVVAVIFIPTAFDVDVATRYGFMWQGRYTLPLAVGVPILSAALMGRGSVRPAVVRRAGALGIPALGLAQLTMFVWGLWRYGVGEPPPGHPYNLSLDPFGGRWQPPLGSGAIFLVFLLGVVLYSTWMMAQMGALGRR